MAVHILKYNFVDYVNKKNNVCNYINEILK